MILRLILLLLFITSLIVGGLLLRTYFQHIRNINKVDISPVEFTKSFNPASKEHVYLKVGGLEGRTIKSPYFPHRELETVTVVEGSIVFESKNGEEKNLSTEGRYVNRDPCWGIFWVEISKFPEPVQFYGPYKERE